MTGTLQDIINEVRGVNVQGSPTGTATSTPEEAEPNTLDDIIKSVRAPTPTGVGAAFPDQSEMSYEIPGFTGHKAHPMLVKVAQEYYGKADPNEALQTWVVDQTWNNANSAAALMDAVKAQTVDIIKAKQMTFLGEQYDKLPAFWEGEDRGIGERASRLWANIWRGVVDPVTWAGGAIGGKIASKVIGEGAGILARASGAAIVDAGAGAAADVSQQVLQKSIGTREEYSPLETAQSAAVMGAFGGLIRGGAGAIKKGFGLLKRPDAVDTPPIKQDNAPLTFEQQQIAKSGTALEQPDAMGVLVRRDNIPAPANANKFPEMEATRPIEGPGIARPEPSSIAEIKNELGMGDVDFGGLKDMDGSITPGNEFKEAPQYKPFDHGLQDNQTPELPKPVVKPVEAPKTEFLAKNPELDNALKNAEDPKPLPEIIRKLDNGDPDLSAPPTVPPRPPTPPTPPPPKVEGPTPLYVEQLEKLTGKVDNMTYMSSPAEMWAEVIRLSEANSGFNTERPQISKEASLASAKELLGDPSLDIFKTLKDKLGVTGDRLSTVVSGALYQYNKDGVQLHTLASDFNEKLWKFGKDSPETLKSLVAYAQYRLKFTDTMKSFYGSRSEIGRSLAMLKPNYNESPEEYLTRLVKDMNGPEGLAGDGAALLCG